MTKTYPLHTGKERSLMDLMDEDASSMFDHALVFETTMTAFCAIDKSFQADEKLLQSLCNKIRINSFTIDNMNEKSHNGHALYIEASIFDHSCRSNAAFIFKGKRLQVRAMRDIPAGEEVLVHYIDILCSKAERQERLWNNWAFTCRCQRCESGDQENEITELAANKSYQESLSPGRLEGMTDDQQADVIFYGLLNVLPIKEKFCGPFDPYMTLDMFVAASAMASKQRKSARDKKDLKKLMHKLDQAIPITHGQDHELFSGLPLMRLAADI